MTGVDLGFVPVVRTPATSEASRDRQARAFTSEAVVHLPLELGPMSAGDAEPLLGHELTHVMHQRVLGDAADEDGPLGDLLEAQARQIEHAMRGHAVEVDVASPGGSARPLAALSWTPSHGFHRHPEPAGAAPLADAPVQRAPVADPRPESPLPNLSGALATVGFGTQDETEGDPRDLVYPELEELLESAAETVESRAELSDEEIERIARRVRPVDVAVPVPAPFDASDPAVLDALAGGLYQRMRTQLRSELLADRERQGLLTEFQ